MWPVVSKRVDSTGVSSNDLYSLLKFKSKIKYTFLFDGKEQNDLVNAKLHFEFLQSCHIYTTKVHVLYKPKTLA